MANRVSVGAMEGIAALYKVGVMGNWSDSQLVGQIATGQEGKEAAFRILIQRHGPMVLGVCRRVLGDEHAAEDAFQATFMVFLKKAGGLRDANHLTNWLYGVALRVAKKERSKVARRRIVERQAAGHTPQFRATTGLTDLRSVIDEEIRRLPERYRLPLVLCHLQGLRHDEVAKRLGCPVGTVESRLSRARAQLRDRLSNRGLAPAPSVMAGLLTPPNEPIIASSLANATSQAALKLTTHRRALDPAIAVASTIERLLGVVPAIRASAFIGSISALAGAAVVFGMTIYQPAGRDPQSESKIPNPQPNVVSQPALNNNQNPVTTLRSPRQQDDFTSTTIPIARHDDPRLKNPPRSPSAIALPMRGISIDGRLDDWPADLARYPIHSQLRTQAGYNTKPVAPAEQTNAYFMVGYDRTSEQIYLAVVVHDRDVVVDPANYLKTDAVEVFINTAASAPQSGPEPQPAVMASRSTNVAKRSIDPFRLDSSGNWRESLDASKMPVLQFAGVPGDVSAYGDPWRANPSLVYGRQKQTTTKMKFHVDGGVITYEWSIQPFDRFPDRPAHLVPGRRLGLDVAIVDKDRDALTRFAPPTYLTWASPPVRFKGIDQGSLGDLLIDRPPDR